MNQACAVARNRRLARRKQAKDGVEVTCQKGSWGLGINLAVTVLDVSEAGIRLILNSALDRGQEFTIALHAPGRVRPFKTLANVVWCIETADGNYCVGASFQRRLAYVDLMVLVTATPA
jgi:hypothetical protein